MNNFSPAHATQPTAANARRVAEQEIARAGARDDAAQVSAATACWKALKKDVRTLGRQQVERLEREISANADLHVHGAPQLGLIAYGSATLDPFAIWGRLAKRGWFTGLVTEPRGVHLMLSPAHAQVIHEYLTDLDAAVSEVRSAGETASDTRARYA